ncbi:hypothetical protein M9H77_17505 [Catharanthus roseus]|uniref:Uncharacterized protein n=1 Tax=Catharanthus roseus TaxID=4058 RepID=A0ACC0B4S6_CATRO|nr:hypothetical protein M9H77_17505 [Catharanthus roseus]
MEKFEYSKNSCELRGYAYFYHGGDSGINAYGGNNHGSGSFTPKRHIRVGNFSPYARTFEHNSYDCYEGNRLGTRNGYNDTSFERVPRNEVKSEGNYVNMDRRFQKRGGSWEKYYDRYNCKRCSQTLGTTPRPLSYNNLKLPLLLELLVLMIMKNGSKKCNYCSIPMTWSLMKQALRTKFGVENHKG